jgi:microcystin-dependent protein
MPTHVHFAQATSANATTAIPSATNVLATSVNYEAYRGATNLVPMEASSITNVGGSQAHLNMQPFRC